jgi:hypothetical protein
MKSLIATGLIAASIGLSGNAAIAGTRHPHGATAITRVLHRHVARPGFRHMYYAGAPFGYYAGAPYGFDVGRFVQAMIGGGPWPGIGIRLPRHARWDRGTYVPQDSPTYDTSPPPDYSGEAQAAAALAESQAIQQMNDSMALTASMQAAEQQNDAAFAAAIQTEINSGM